MVSVTNTTLLTDYTRWLTFVTTARRTVRRYDRQLARIASQHAHLSELSRYLRNCMHQRSQFFGNLALQLTGCVAQLRTEPDNESLIRRLTLARPIMQGLMTELEAAFAELNAEYRQLLPPQQTVRYKSLTPIFSRQQHRVDG